MDLCWAYSKASQKLAPYVKSTPFLMRTLAVRFFAVLSPSRSICSRMAPRVSLDEQETNIKRFLLNASEHISKCGNFQKPTIRFVGGWVRDKLRGEESKDIDVAIDCMTGKEFYLGLKAYEDELLKDRTTATTVLGKLAEIKKDADKSKHLETATTRLFGVDIDLVNLRTETYSEESRNPVMQMGTAEDDAMRRDATINALFYNLTTDEIEDFTGKGLADLQARRIRTPLDPEQTFRDDPLRILRLIRFACRFNYKIDDNVKHCMTDHAVQTALANKISRERVLIEFEKMLKGPERSS